jgi:hypothetical protein
MHDCRHELNLTSRNIIIRRDCELKLNYIILNDQNIKKNKIKDS